MLTSQTKTNASPVSWRYSARKSRLCPDNNIFLRFIAQDFRAGPRKYYAGTLERLCRDMTTSCKKITTMQRVLTQNLCAALCAELTNSTSNSPYLSFLECNHTDISIRADTRNAHNFMHNMALIYVCTVRM